MKTQIRIAVFSLLAFLCFAWTSTASAQILYNNGPMNGGIYPFEIDGSQQVSNSFTLTYDSQLTSFTFGVWVFAHDIPLTVDYGISATSFGTNLASGTATLSNVLWGGGSFANFDYYESTGPLPIDLPPGSYYLTLTNAITSWGGL